MAQHYDLSFPFEKPGIRQKWMKIGYATAIGGGKIACTLTSVPLTGWNGTFYLLPTDRKEPDAEVKVSQDL